MSIHRSSGEIRRHFVRTKPRLIGRSPKIRRVRSLIVKYARAQRTTLIHGESGTGKDVVARVMHRIGARQGAKAPFFALHCASVPDTLFESELFGHRRGAFTGAESDRIGVAEAAANGTLFLDEIDSLSLVAQAKLLQLLETGEFRSLGSNRVRHTNAWILIATNSDLRERVRQGLFRADLLYRIEVLRLSLPPLRKRGDDVLRLADHFLSNDVNRVFKLSSRAREALHAHLWPGNVRELKHAIERGIALTDDGTLEPEHLKLTAPTAPSAERSLQASLSELIASGLNLRFALAHCESHLLRAAIRANGGNRARAAEQLGIDRKTLYRKLARYEADRADAGTGDTRAPALGQ